MRLAIVLGLLVLCLTGTTARADDGLRCGPNLVSVGASTGEVIEYWTYVEVGAWGTRR
jgi:hypothetical protein